MLTVEHYELIRREAEISNTQGVFGETSGISGRGVVGNGVLGHSSSGTGGYFNSLSGYGIIVEDGNVGSGLFMLRC